ncbi:sensor histidine kinase [Cohnella panacarvi]|uniref:sensor histidine kinase n=1 Tax=Cohnella panacarvi TaxID=400776 RepID=UPI00047E610B|nr:HAMP domain-containing sensor histidine kinase [Cohnella panacarvi]
MERIKHPKLNFPSMWRNTSVRRLAWAILALTIIACSALALYAGLATERLKQRWLEQEYAIAGALSRDHPELAQQWATLLAEPPSAQGIEDGKRWLEQYSVTPQLSARWLPVLDDFQSWSLILLIPAALLLLALLSLWLFRESRNQLKTLRSLAHALDDTVKHNLPMAERYYGEGELGLLANGVQELSLRLRETIEQLNRDKTFLKDTVADISHQLKTPLASLMIYIELLASGKTDPANAAEFLATCRRELDRMEWLILTLLKLARIEADALELQAVPARFSDTLSASLHAVERLAEERRVAIDLVGHDPELLIPHDSHWLAEAISNVLKNAVEISPSGSRITVSWERTPIFVRLKIADRGPGIPEQHLPHIFKKFYRTSSGGSGVGLGLPLAKSIVEKHGGVLSAGNSPGGGAVFYLTLPLQPWLTNDPTNLTKL